MCGDLERHFSNAVRPSAAAVGAMSAERPLLVQALYTFKATNNDELTFRKGDVITVTQRDDPDWWEGTLDDVTGWFPSNYVKECAAAGEGQCAAACSPFVVVG